MSRTDSLPILYSTIYCPYCIRARMALAACGIKVELREVELENKPDALLKASPKGTVPTLILPDGKVIDESMDIINWALDQADFLGWRNYSLSEETVHQLIEENDATFAKAAIRLRYPERYPDLTEEDKAHWVAVAKAFLTKLEKRLQQSRYLANNHITLLDVAIAPFIFKYAEYRTKPGNTADFEKLSGWVNGFYNSDIHRHVMREYAPWSEGDDPIIFSG